MIKFQDLEQFTEDDIDAALRRNDREELRLLPIIVALAAPDRSMAEAVCIKLSSDNDNKTRGHALISLGYLARRFRMLDEKTVKPLIENGILDPDEYVRMHAKSAADEIHQFLHWEIAKHIYG